MLTGASISKPESVVNRKVEKAPFYVANYCAMLFSSLVLKIFRYSNTIFSDAIKPLPSGEYTADLSAHFNLFVVEVSIKRF